MSHYCIYSLNEPDTETVRYIGLTGKTLKERLWGHTSKSKLKTRKASWILSLKNKGTKPDIILIEDGLSLEEAKKKEVHYILMFKSFGARLVNGTAGGDGLFNCTQEVRDKIGAAHRGKKLSPEHERIKKAMFHVYEKYDPEILNKYSIKLAIEAYKGLQYDPKIHLAERYQKKIDRLLEILDEEDSATAIEKNTKEAIRETGLTYDK